LEEAMPSHKLLDERFEQALEMSISTSNLTQEILGGNVLPGVANRHMLLLLGHQSVLLMGIYSELVASRQASAGSSRSLGEDAPPDGGEDR
jgi:hypothetical protein